MATRITQIEDPERDRTILRVEGSLAVEDAELLERLCKTLEQKSDQRVTIDVTDLHFLDSEAASVLRRLKQEQNVDLEGVHFFIQKVIEMTERSASRGTIQ
jgi:anti-anti-sigma factor